MKTRAISTFAIAFGLAACLSACSSDGSKPNEHSSKGGSAGKGAGGSTSQHANGGSNASEDAGSTPSGNGGSDMTGGDAAPAVGGKPSTGGGGKSTIDVPPSTTQIDATFPKADVLPKLTNVTATMREDSVAIDFDPFDGATDYRVFVMPDDASVTTDSGSVVVRNATYRCAGTRQGWDASNNMNSGDSSLVLAQGMYSFKNTIPANPTLGYVYKTAGGGRTPVYALAGYPSPPEYGWRESRMKVYTTDESERTMLLGQNFRDDGIVFYVPAAGANTSNVFTSSVTNNGSHQQYYFADADKAAHAGDTVPPKVAFPVLTATAADAVPLMAVTYGGAPHTELAAGKDRFQKAAYQGNGPLWHLEWSGLTGPTTLVVEALSSGCPFQGMLSATHLDASPKGDQNAAHQAFLTLDELRKASATGEVFVNGQYDVTTNPKAVARSFLKVAPQPHKASDWDWYQGFAMGTDFEALTPGTVDPQKCWQCTRGKNSIFDVATYNIESSTAGRVQTFGNVLGQLLLDFDDYAQDTTGKVRFTALQKAQIDADPEKFLHVTMSVDIVSTDRRYPQLIISDQDAPVQEGLNNANQNSLLVQSIIGPSSRIEAQAIHGLVGTGTVGPWDVNNQAPSHAFMDFDNYDVKTGRPPTDPAFEHSGVDEMTRFDVYVSSSRMYLLFDGKPAGCSKYPSNFALKGAVTVTFGAVMYHEGAPDEMVWNQPKPYGYWHRHEATESKRHFDDLAFKSGVAQPQWDDSKFPCQAY